MNRLKEIIEERERPHFPFTPKRAFYKTLKIGQKRFWQIARNETQPTICEMERIAKFFGIKTTDLLAQNRNKNG